MKKIRLIQLLFLSLFLIGTYLPTQAQKIDTISVYSTSMKKQIKNIIILPASYTQNTQKKYPVAYLLTVMEDVTIRGPPIQNPIWLKWLLISI